MRTRRDVAAAAQGAGRLGRSPGGPDQRGAEGGVADTRGHGLDADEGSALVEAIVVIAVLLLPLLWVATSLVRVEAASFAVRSAAREAARTYVTAPSSGAGSVRANVSARLAFEDQRSPVGTATITCTASPCLTPGAQVSATARTSVGLPFVPRWLSGPAGLEIHLSSRHVEKVEQYGGQR